MSKTRLHRLAALLLLPMLCGFVRADLPVTLLGGTDQAPGPPIDRLKVLRLYSQAVRPVNQELTPAVGGHETAPDPPRRIYDSFEQGVPDHWLSSREGSLRVSAQHYKHGTHSLRWDFRAGDTILVEVDLGNIGRYGGYGGTYSKASFGVWLYCREPLAGSVRFDFRTDEETDAWFDFPVNFTGWRRAHLKYTVAPHSHLAETRWAVEFEGRVRPSINNILINAPADVEAGSVFFDLVVYNGLLDYRRQYLPTGDSWEPFQPEPSIFPLPELASEAEIEGIESLGQRFDTMVAGRGSVDEARMGSLRNHVEALGIVRDEHGIRGRPVVHARWMEFYEGIDEVTPASDIATLMLALGRAYHWTDDGGMRDQIAEWYCLLAEHLRDQGMAAGTGFSWGWYDGRNLGEANYLMRHTLRERGLLAWAVSFLDYSYGFSRIFDDSTVSPNMDYFHMDVRYRLYGCLMQVEQAEQVRYLRAYSRRLRLDILTEDMANGYKSDGSAFHHGFHYFAYAGIGTRSLVNVVEPLSHTVYRLCPAAMERLKQVVLAMRFYCNLRDLPLPLTGRHPFSQSLDPNVLRTLARCGSPDGAVELDPDLAAAYLRLVPEAADDEVYRQHGIMPETLEGNMTMNYAGLTAHRRDRWLALVKGYSKYVRFGEIYANNNRYGRYISHGTLDILGGGDPVTREGSGCVQPGWDWNRMDGTTVIYLPLHKLVAVSSGTENVPSEEVFVGGLSHRGRNGVFVMQIHGAKHHEPSFRAKKTYHFFDNRIVCLGSDIENTDADHPTRTNLFQKALPEAHVPIWCSGREIVDLPFSLELPAADPGWMVDTQETGYYLPAGQRVRMARQRQSSRDQQDKEDTEGDFATAWIDHGPAPRDQSYEYCVVIRTTPAAMDQFTRVMASEQAPDPYLVLRKDARAHVVYDRGTRTCACVLFTPQDVDINVPAYRDWPDRVPEAVTDHEATPAASQPLPVTAVDTPCLLMLEALSRDRWHVSIADPDLRLERTDHRIFSQVHELRVTLAPGWKVQDASPTVRVVEEGQGRTVLAVVCRHGASSEVVLVR